MSVNVSQNVQAIRKKLGFSEEQVSTYLGVTRSVLRKYESNTDSIPFDVFDKLSNLYGVDMSVFFEENMAEADILASGKEIAARKEIKETKYISAEEAWETFQKEYFK